MALKDWDLVPYGAADCVRDHTEWNNMIEYIKHAGSCANAGGFVLYDDDASTNIYFEFYGGTSIDFLEDRAIHIDDDETYVGHGAGDAITTGINNTLYGHDTGNALTSGISNVMLGMNAGSIGAGINECVFVGTNAGQNVINSGLTAIGYNALNAACSGVNNTAVGYSSLLVNTTGYANTAVGKNTLFANIDGYYNTMLGAYSGDTITSGFYNVGVGGGTFRALTIGDNNTAVGTSAGGAAAADTNSCVYLGFSAGNNNAVSNRLYINSNSSVFPLIYGEFDTDTVKFGNNVSMWFLDVAYTTPLTTITGNANANGQLRLNANSVDTTALSLFFDGANDNIWMYVPAAGNVKMSSAGETIAQFKTDGANTTIEGGGASADNLILKGNSVNVYSNINIHGNAHIGYTSHTGTHHYFYSGATSIGTLGLNGIDFEIQSSGVNADIILNPNGSGLVRFGLYAAKGAEAFAGFITMQDEGGTPRKVMICA